MAGLRTALQVGVFLIVALLMAAVAGQLGFNWAARRRAEQAQSQLQVGQGCTHLLRVAEQLADDYSIERAQVACRVGYDSEVPLAFTRGFSLTYLITVKVGDGRISSISSIGAY